MSDRLFNDLDSVLDIVRSCGDARKIDTMLRRARARGIEEVLDEHRDNPWVAPVVVMYRGTLQDTLHFALSLGECEGIRRWSGFSGSCLHSLERDRDFMQNWLSLRIVDFGANSNVPIQNLQSDSGVASKLAGLEVLFALSQHPKWMTHGPSTLAAGLCVNTESFRFSPLVWRPSFLREGVTLADVRRVDDTFPRYRIPLRLF